VNGTNLQSLHCAVFPLFVLALIVSGRTYGATPTSAPAPVITVAPAVEDNQKVLHALVTIEEKPIKNVKLTFGVKRTFGLLSLGEDTTDDEGTAAVPFPRELPGNDRGEFEVVATIVSPESYANVTAVQWVPGGVAIRAPGTPTFPRALWGTYAPWPLAITVVVLIGAVWLTYVRVIGLILAIRKGGQS
jgi:hypothetical protein